MNGKQTIGRGGFLAFGAGLAMALITGCAATGGAQGPVVAASAASASAVSGGSAGSATAAPTAASAASTRATTSGTPATTAPGTVAPAATPECTAAGLKITGSSGGAGLGHDAEVLKFTNTGTRACFMQGYPGVAEMRGAVTIQNAARTLGGYLGGLGQAYTAPPRVVVQPGQSATAKVEALDAAPDGSATCIDQGATALLVTAPDQQASTSVPVVLAACADFQVHPVVGSQDGDEE
jgi:Protein of unknown function (DUF4232)